MEFAWNDEQRAFRETVRSFLAANLPSDCDGSSDNTVTPEQAVLDSQRIADIDYAGQAIEKADHFLALISPTSLDSKWVKKEIKHAREVQKDREGYKVIPILLDGVPPSVLPRLFGKEPVAVMLSSDVGGADRALPELERARAA